MRRIDKYRLFNWNYIPSVGKSGSILCGTKMESFDVVSCVQHKYILLINVFDKHNQVPWTVCTVYGAAHEDQKREFLVELAEVCSRIHGPYIVGGDFNILRHCGEKNKNWRNSPHVDMFNAIIYSLNLIEIFTAGGLYTWSNNQSHPTLEKLDRVLMSDDWEHIFLDVTVRKLVRDLSDHNALLLDTGTKTSLANIS